MLVSEISYLHLNVIYVDIKIIIFYAFSFTAGELSVRQENICCKTRRLLPSQQSHQSGRGINHS